MVLELIIIDLIIFMALTALGGCLCIEYVYIKPIIHCLKHEVARIFGFPKWYTFWESFTLPFIILINLYSFSSSISTFINPKSQRKYRFKVFLLA